MEALKRNGADADSIRFEKKTISNPYKPGTLILAQIIVNGNDFLDTVSRYELPYARKYNQESIAGGYAYQFASELYPQLKAANGGEVPLLICGGCLGEGCWDLIATVTEDDAYIVWKNFHNPHRDADSPGGFWDFTDFGALRFHKEEYKKAVEAIRQFYM